MNCLMLIKKRNAVALHLLSIELEFVQYLNIRIFGFLAQILKRMLCNSWMRWVKLPLAEEGYLAQNLGMYQSILDLETQDGGWYRQLKRSHTYRPKLTSVEGLSVPLQSLPKGYQKSSDSAGNCRKGRDLVCVNPPSFLTSSPPRKNSRLPKLSADLHLQRLTFIS